MAKKKKIKEDKMTKVDKALEDKVIQNLLTITKKI